MRPRRPTLLDADDRRIVGMGLVVLLAFVLVCMAIGAGLGLGVRVYSLMAGG